MDKTKRKETEKLKQNENSVSIRIDRDVHLLLKLDAVQSGKNLTDLATEIIQKYYRKKQNKKS